MRVAVGGGREHPAAAAKRLRCGLEAQLRLGHRLGGDLLGGVPDRRAHDDLNLQKRRILLAPQLADQRQIVVVDPGAQERRRHGQPRHALARFHQFQAAEPGRKDFRAEARFQFQHHPVKAGMRLSHVHVEDLLRGIIFFFRRWRSRAGRAQRQFTRCTH
jgi:hypothetical protein